MEGVGVLRKTPSKKVNINHNAMAMINEGIQVYGKGETNSVSLSRPRPSIDEEDAMNTSTQPGKTPHEHNQMKSMLELSIHRCSYIQSYSGINTTHSTI